MHAVGPPIAAHDLHELTSSRLVLDPSRITGANGIASSDIADAIAEELTQRRYGVERGAARAPAAHEAVEIFELQLAGLCLEVKVSLGAREPAGALARLVSFCSLGRASVTLVRHPTAFALHTSGTVAGKPLGPRSQSAVDLGVLRANKRLPLIGGASHR
jgi:hypothetical protein